MKQTLNPIPQTLQVKARKTEMARYETLDNGKPIIESEADMVSCLRVTPSDQKHNRITQFIPRS